MKWGQEVFFLLIQTLPTLWATQTWNLRIVVFLTFFGSQISRFPGPRFSNFQKSGLGPAWAQLEPSLGPAWAQLEPDLGPAWACIYRSSRMKNAIHPHQGRIAARAAFWPFRVHRAKIPSVISFCRKTKRHTKILKKKRPVNI